MLMAFRNEKGKWAFINLENFAYKLILIFDRINYFWSKKKPLEEAKFWIIAVKIFISSWLGEMNSYTITSTNTKKKQWL